VKDAIQLDDVILLYKSECKQGTSSYEVNLSSSILNYWLSKIA